MSELTYKKIIDVEQVETLNDAATVFINDNGAMKQVAADKFGAVKTVNGVEPDENGNIESIVVIRNVQENNTITVTSNSDLLWTTLPSNPDMLKIIQIVVPSNGNAVSYSMNSYELQELVFSEQYDILKMIFRLSFGGNAPDLLADALAQTITLDPDWVAPAACVKTVNGVAPDENGDIVVEVPELAKPDWNQNDPTAADYVKNRTHWAETTATTTIADNVTVEIMNGQPTNNPFTMNEIIEGQTYTITWNGTTHKCVAYVAEGPNSPSLGNGTLINNLSGGNGEPFFITVYEGNVMVFAAAGTHTVSIVTDIETVHPIDVKYIPISDRTPGEEVKLNTLLDFIVSNERYDATYGSYVFSINDLPIYVDFDTLYTVIIDDVTYKNVPIEPTGGASVRIGNINAGTSPFEIRCVYANEGFVAREFHITSEGDRHEIKVGIVELTVTTLDEKYIPDTIARKSDLEDLGGTGGYEFILCGTNGGYYWGKGNGLDFINRLIDGPAPFVCVHTTNTDHEYPSVYMCVPYRIEIASGSGKWCAIFPEPNASGIFIDMETGEIQND